jgi:voltage-gated potassium channel
LAIRRADRNLIVGPMGDTLLLEGDSLICLGTVEQLRSLNEILSPRNPPDLRLPNQKKNSNLK